MERIEELLWEKTITELAELCTIAGIKGRSGGTKADKIKLLLGFYSNENWVKEVFENLTKFEKEMMKCIIQNKYHPQENEIEKILKKYKTNKHYYSASYFDRKSKVKLFYINGQNTIPIEFKRELNKLFKPLEIEIEPEKENLDPEEFYANIIGRDERTSDFDEFIKFINTNKIKAMNIFKKIVQMKYLQM